MNQLKTPLLLLLSICLQGCADQLIYNHSTALGVDVGVRPDETSGHVMIGYDRDTYALVPKKSGAGATDEAMSLASVSCLDIEGLTQFHYNQFIATGLSAAAIAKDSNTVKQIQNALLGSNKTCVE
jgi:hypothetical protein